MSIACSFPEIPPKLVKTAGKRFAAGAEVRFALWDGSPVAP